MPEQGRDVVDLFKLTAKDLATSDNYYYPVDDPDSLEFIFGEVADDIVNQLQEITFSYAKLYGGDDSTAVCYFTNDYFADSSYKYNPSLATMSLSFAMSAFGSGKGGQSDYSNKSINAKKLLMDIGVQEENIQTNDWFTQKPTTDSIGVIVGNMPITVKGEECTLIAAAVRGQGYEQEWASNFTIGKNGQHNGFDTAKNNVINYLKKYIKEQNITGSVKFWITGYSRAAATANLVGGAINNGTIISSDINYDSDDIYTYCFETPAGALVSEVKGDEKYNNIFNIINSSDPVPYVAPAAMGFGRYGIDYYLPSAESDPVNYDRLKQKMEKIYYSLDGTDEYIVDDFQMKKLSINKNLFKDGFSSFVQDDTINNYSQGLFLANYVGILSNEFLKDRNNYVDKYEDTFRLIFTISNGFSDAQLDAIWDSFSNQVKEEWYKLVVPVAFPNINKFIGFETKEDVVLGWLKKALVDAGIMNYNEQTLKEAANELVELLVGAVLTHPNYTTTLICNIENIGAAHYPELCYSWVASMDKNYVEGVKVEFNNGGYRIIRINCAVDVDVYDENGNKVASIENEQPDTTLKSSYIYGVDDDGQKYIVLPIDTDYEISIIGREDDLVNYSISEYCATAGLYTRNINYFNINLKEGEKLNGTIPSYSEDEIENDTVNGSNVIYTLLDSNNNLIESDYDKSGVAVSQDVFYVNVLSSNPDYGIVLGSGVHQYGTFAQVEAIVFEGYQFVGWYVDNHCVSTDAVYRMCIIEDVELIGKFEKATCPHDETEIRDDYVNSCEDGYTGDIYCKACGDKISTGQVIDGIHKFDKVDAVSATHEKDGNHEYYSCSDCGKIFAEEDAITEILFADTIISRGEHNYKDSYMNNSDEHWKSCECGSIINKSVHDYGEWLIIKEATTIEKGSKEKICKVCGNKITEDIPIINNTSNDGYENSPQTGDASNVVLWSILVVFSCVGFLVSDCLRRKYAK